MTDHLPECPASRPDTPHVVSIAAEACQFWGICDRLRACEQRVTQRHNAEHEDDRLAAFQNGYAAALDAARDAVKQMCHQYPFIWPTDNASMEALDELLDGLDKP